MAGSWAVDLCARRERAGICSGRPNPFPIRDNFRTRSRNGCEATAGLSSESLRMDLPLRVRFVIAGVGAKASASHEAGPLRTYVPGSKRASCSRFALPRGKPRHILNLLPLRRFSLRYPSNPRNDHSASTKLFPLAYREECVQSHLGKRDVDVKRTNQRCTMNQSTCSTPGAEREDGRREADADMSADFGADVTAREG